MRNLRRSLPVLGLVALLLLTACNPGAGSSEPTAAPTDVPEVAPTETSPEFDVPQPAPTGDPGQPITVIAPEVPGICEAAPLPEVPVRPADETDYVKGASLEDAEIIIYEYSDFQCPGCAAMAPVLTEFLQRHPNVALVYRHFPLDFHVHANITAQAVEAAGEQGKFWEMHDLLFVHAQEWSSLSAEEMRSLLTDYAGEIDLDVEAFDSALDDGTYAEKVQSQYEESISLGLPGTPTFLFNEVPYPSDIGLSMQGLESFLSILQNEDDLFYAAPPEMMVETEDVYEALFKTSKGDIRVNLLPVSAPTNVNSFIFLAEEDWYDGAEFFFVRDNFVAISGDPTNSTIGYPGYYCEGETQGDFDRPGLVGMLANGQFFFTLGSDAAQLSGQFPLIGQVVEGLDVLDDIARRAVGDPMAPVADVLESIEITRP